MSAAQRTAFFVSDRTAITAETLGHSLLTQFDGIVVKRVSLRFVDNVERARQVVARIEQAALEDGQRPLVFSTLIDAQVRDILRATPCVFLDFFDTFIAPLEQELQVKSTLTAGRSQVSRTCSPTRPASTPSTSPSTTTMAAP
ncbi:MAG: kinase/pyrophosphorylase [Candidatus Competibacterales bacterium]